MIEKSKPAPDPFSLEDCALVMSAFRTSPEALAGLKRYLDDQSLRFGAVHIVDSEAQISSLPTGLKQAHVHYHAVRENIGSAGNLAKRLAIAFSKPGIRYAFALNHDGYLEKANVARLRSFAIAEEVDGAVYPARVRVGRGRKPQEHFGVWPRQLAFLSRSHDAIWASSNGALYCHAPFQAGLLPRADYWMGWEDLEYGLQLKEHGFRQAICEDVSFQDSYEYRSHQVGPMVLSLTDKAPWYAYYSVRNLIETAKCHPENAAAVLCRVALEIGSTALFRDRKPMRFRNMVRGVSHGVRGVLGKQN